MFDSTRVKVIIFDMDDTLYPERDYVLSGFRAVARWVERQLEIPYEQGYTHLKSQFEASVRGNTFNNFLRDFGQSEAAVGQLVTIYREHQPVIAPFPEIPPLLAQLNGRFQLGLVSDGYLAVQQKKFAALGLARYFQTIVFSDQWGRDAWKPAHEPFLAVLDKLNAQPETAVYIGDNPTKDFLGANQLGLQTIWYTGASGDYSTKQPPTAEHAPHLTINSVAALQDTFAARRTV